MGKVQTIVFIYIYKIIIIIVNDISFKVQTIVFLVDRTNNCFYMYKK